jgi:peptidoglycan/xylan/chitin deacetylase (PgdA/CDA1 family)
MSAEYLVRFDDICPTMNWDVWQPVEQILIREGIKPLLAVVPDNQDQNLDVDPPRNDFWDHVRSWRERGWTIGMHGYQHRYLTQDAGILRINHYSEFAGLPQEVQASKLRTAFEIFEREGVRPDAFIAPAHSLDCATLQALKGVGLRRISDGFFLFPNVDSAGMLWIPQQLWRFRPMPFGVWSVCFHINHWSQRDILQFQGDIRRYGRRIISFEDAITRYGERCPDWKEKLFKMAFPQFLRLRLILRSLLQAESSRP